MSGPMPGPMRPPTDDPKSNVMLYYALGAIVLTFSLATLPPGYWRLSAIPSGVLVVLLIMAAVRSRVAAQKRDLEQD